jgi:hypothetical protein
MKKYLPCYLSGLLGMATLLGLLLIGNCVKKVYNHRVVWTVKAGDIIENTDNTCRYILIEGDYEHRATYDDSLWKTPSLKGRAVIEGTFMYDYGGSIRLGEIEKFSFGARAPKVVGSIPKKMYSEGY